MILHVLVHPSCCCWLIIGPIRSIFPSQLALRVHLLLRFLASGRNLRHAPIEQNSPASFINVIDDLAVSKRPIIDTTGEPDQRRRGRPIDCLPLAGRSVGSNRRNGPDLNGRGILFLQPIIYPASGRVDRITSRPEPVTAKIWPGPCLFHLNRLIS